MNNKKELCKTIITLLIIYVLTIFPVSPSIGLYSKPISSKERFLIYIGIIIIDTILYLFIKRSKKAFEKQYIILFFIIGMMYMLFIPMGRMPDEQSHFLRAYEISQGNLISEKGENGGGGRSLPSNLLSIFQYNGNTTYEKEFSKIKVKENKDNKFMYFPNTSVYSFISYLPQSIGILIGRVFKFPVLIQAYLGRLFNLICITIAMYFVFKIIPFKKYLTVLICFMPMFMQEAASLSPDCITNAMAFLLIAYVMHIRYDKNKMVDKKDKILLSLITIVLSLCKIVYLPICLILFMIPKEKIKDNNKYKFIICLAIITIVLNGIWLIISSNYLNEIRAGVNPGMQIKYLITHPISYIKVLYNSWYSGSDLYIFNIIGLHLCYFDVHITYLYVIIYFSIIFYYFIVNNDKRIELKDKALPIFIMISTLLLIFTSLYIQWTPLYSKIVEGVQGRYFIPILLLLLIIIDNKKVVIKKENNYDLINLSILIINIYSLTELFIYHF